MEHEEKQTRRDFFKKVASAALPMLASIALGSGLTEKLLASDASSGCSGNCTGLCTTTCYGDCVPTAAPDLVRGAAVQAVLVIAQKHALATVLVLVLALVDISARAVAIHHAEKPVHISAKEHV